MIADGYIPAWSNGPEPEFRSHESVSMLNAGDQDATVSVTLYFEDRDPYGPYTVRVPARRTVHQRINELDDPAVPSNLGYSIVVDSDLPIVCQHTRLDSRQSENALLSTIAWPAD